MREPLPSSLTAVHSTLTEISLAFFLGFFLPRVWRMMHLRDMADVGVDGGQAEEGGDGSPGQGRSE